MSSTSNDSFNQPEGRITLSDDAPEVNLGALILENHGLEIIENHPIMGRVIVATTDLDESLLFQSVLKELPALVCKPQDYLDFMEQFLDAPIELQVGILDMFYQPLDSDIGKSLIEPAKALFMVGVLEDLTVIHQLLSIYMTNGHVYRGTHTAIPLFGSKFAHSCVPNIGYSSLASEDGALEYKMLRPIKKGELVCFSYISDLLETPTPERRQLLQETKTFRCHCVRCTGPDYCRSMPCPHCLARVPCRYRSHLDEPYWECSNCAMLEADALVRTEREFEKIIDDLNQKIEKRKNFQSVDREVTPTLLRELVDDCVTNLSQTHHLTIKGLRLLLTQTTANAFVKIKSLVSRGLPVGAPPVYSLLRESVDAGFQIVLAGECVAAECPGCQIVGHGSEIGVRGLDFCPKHEPNYDRALVCRHICDNLLRIPVFWWPPSGLIMVMRYVPLMRARFGSLMASIEEHISRLSEALICIECQTYWDASRCNTIPPPEPTDTSEHRDVRVRNAGHAASTKQSQVTSGKDTRKKKGNKKKKTRK